MHRKTEFASKSVQLRFGIYALRTAPDINTEYVYIDIAMILASSSVCQNGKKQLM